MSDGAESRREALRRAALGAGGLTLAGLVVPVLARGQAPADEDLRDFLVEAIGMEQVAVLAYSTVAGAGRTDPGLRGLLELFRGHEQAHADALTSAIDSLGFEAPDAPNAADDTAVFDEVEGLSDDARSRLVDLLGEIGDLGAQSPERRLSFLRDLEAEMLGFYVERGPALDSQDLSTTSAEIAGCQAQHHAVIAQQLGDSPEAAALAVSEASTTASDAAVSEATSSEDDTSGS